VALLRGTFRRTPCHSYCPAGNSTKHLVKAWWRPSWFQLRYQKLPWDCLHGAMEKKTGNSILTKSFTRPESPWSFALVTSKTFGVLFRFGDCRGTATALSERLYLGPRHSWNLSTLPSIRAPSNRSLYGSARPTFWASTVILTTVVTSCHWNKSIEYIFIQLLLYFFSRTLLLLMTFLEQISDPSALSL
jgi:hypothetical protein